MNIRLSGGLISFANDKHEEGDLSLDEGWHESEDALELSSPNMDMITIISYHHHHTMITSSQVCGGDIDNIDQHPHHRRHEHRGQS